MKWRGLRSKSHNLLARYCLVDSASLPLETRNDGICIPYDTSTTSAVDWWDHGVHDQHQAEAFLACGKRDTVTMRICAGCGFEILFFETLQSFFFKNKFFFEKINVKPRADFLQQLSNCTY
ncbi:unnamed protein product [Pylaiella littoralis]